MHVFHSHGLMALQCKGISGQSAILQSCTKQEYFWHAGVRPVQQLWLQVK